MNRRRINAAEAVAQELIKEASRFRIYSLPDTSHALGIMRDSLWEDFQLRRRRFEHKKATMAVVAPTLPCNQSPEYMGMLVAHRRWLHAFEKFERLFGALKSPSAL